MVKVSIRKTLYVEPLTKLIFRNDGLCRLDGIRLSDLVDGHDRETVLTAVFEVVDFVTSWGRCSTTGPDIAVENKYNFNSKVLLGGGSWYFRLVSCDAKDVYAMKPVL